MTRFQVHCTYLSVVVLFLSACFFHWLGLCLLQGSPQYISYRSYIFIYIFSGGLSHGGLIAANGGGDKFDWEPRSSSKHQIVWTVLRNCWLAGIIGACYFSQMRWPDGFLSSPSFPVMYIIIWCNLFTSPLVWGVVGHGLQSFDAKNLAHFLNYATHEPSTSISQEPGWGTKDRDVTSI